MTSTAFAGAAETTGASGAAAAGAAAGAAQVQQHERRADAVHAAGSAAIFLSLLAVPAAAALKLAEQLLILHVARLHACGLPRIFHCLRIIMQAALRQRAEKIPASVSLSGGHAAQRVERLGIMARVDIVLCRAHLDGIVLLSLPISGAAITAVCAPERSKRIIRLRLSLLLCAAVVAAARALAAALPPVHDLLIRLLHFHKFLFGLRGVRLAHVRIGVILLAERSIGLFYLVVAGRRGYAQNLIRICHCLLFAFLRSHAPSKRSHMPE